MEGARDPAGVALLHEDPELAAGLSEPDLELARRVLIVPALTVEVGPWDLASATAPPTLGLLVLDGLITVNIVVGDRVTAQLAGPGDILHGSTTPEALVPVGVEYFVSERARVAVLDRRFIAAVRRWPALLLALHERLRVQEHRLAVHAAMGKLRRVDDRILTLCWHLAERWGRMTRDGVILPLALTHETIGRLVGAERPTVTLALGDLARSGELTRRADGAFVLREDSRARLRPAEGARPQVRPLAVSRTAGSQPVAPSPTIDVDALSERIDALQDELPTRHAEVDDLLDVARQTSRRSAETRERIAAKRFERTGRP